IKAEFHGCLVTCRFHTQERVEQSPEVVVWLAGEHRPGDLCHVPEILAVIIETDVEERTLEPPQEAPLALSQEHGSIKGLRSDAIVCTAVLGSVKERLPKGTFHLLIEV